MGDQGIYEQGSITPYVVFTGEKNFNEIKEKLEFMECDAYSADGLEDCAIALAMNYHSEPFIVYSKRLIIEKLMNSDGMTHEEALEFFEFNIIGAYPGDPIPAFLLDEE